MCVYVCVCVLTYHVCTNYKYNNIIHDVLTSIIQYYMVIQYYNSVCTCTCLVDHWKREFHAIYMYMHNFYLHVQYVVVHSKYVCQK